MDNAKESREYAEAASSAAQFIYRHSAPDVTGEHDSIAWAIAAQTQAQAATAHAILELAEAIRDSKND